MTDRLVPLLSKNQETDDIVSFRFGTKGKPIAYVAGQFLRMGFPEIVDPRGPSRFFSISSSPTEDFVTITTKISEREMPYGTSQSPFKQKLASLPIGEDVNIQAPFGKFVLGDIEKQYLFLGGGIGITPFRSMIKYATDKKLPHKITLLYSNQTPDDIVFREELDQCAKENPNVTIVHTITRPEESRPKDDQPLAEKTAWSGKTGRINEELVREYAKDLINTVFYICGPLGMVDTLSTLVMGMGVLEENIRIERFTGYA